MSIKKFVNLKLVSVDKIIMVTRVVQLYEFILNLNSNKH